MVLSWDFNTYTEGDIAKGPQKARVETEALAKAKNLEKLFPSKKKKKTQPKISAHHSKKEVGKCGSPDANWYFSYCLRIPAEAPNLRTINEKYPSDSEGTG